MSDTLPWQSFLSRLERTWPSAWRNIQTAQPEHPLFGEVLALSSAKTCHLPFFRGSDEAAWITIAPDATSLRGAIAGLKAWLIPSVAWEDRTQPIVAPDNYAGPFAGELLALAPAGYYRWHSRGSVSYVQIPEKLRLWRQLQSYRPTFATARPLTLFELRQQFGLAMATADRDLAEAAIVAIDARQLDTAVNTLFMRTQLRARFGSFSEITEEPRLQELISLRLPRSVRVAIIQAFFEVYLREAEEKGEYEVATRQYTSNVHPSIASLLSISRDSDGDVVARALKYYGKYSAPTPSPTLPPAAAFLDALRRTDWVGVQESGVRLLCKGEVSAALRAIVSTALTQSLGFQANEAVAKLLEQRQPIPPPAQNWSEFVACVRSGDRNRATPFLTAPQRTPLDLSDPDAVRDILVAVEEITTDPEQEVSGGPAGIMTLALPVLVEDLVADPAYPRPELARSYVLLLELWTQQRIAQLRPADSSAAIMLAAASLRCVADAEGLVTGILQQWWTARPVRARIPFLLDVLDLLAEHSRDFSRAQGLWVDGVEFVRSYSVELSRGDRVLWRSLGSRLGFDTATVDEYLPLAAERDEESDPLSSAVLKKIAIVSLHEKAAQAAGAIITARTGSQVILVAEQVAGPMTENARHADVILMVWAATKHAVYRAFDGLRDKLAYVQGTGPSSIVLTLERWVSTHNRAG